MLRKDSSFTLGKKVVRETYAQRMSTISIKTQENQEKAVSDVIMNINFGEDAMILVSKQLIVIYSMINMRIFYTRKGHFWDAIFIPNTSMIAVVQHDNQPKSKKTLKIVDLNKDVVAATLAISFQIQKIKVSKNCICLIGENQLSVIHFPTLKPICHELAGTGLSIICDISFEGLTLGYNCQKKGVIVINNFSSVYAEKARRKSGDQFSNNKKSFIQALQNPKKSSVIVTSSFLGQQIPQNIKIPEKRIQINAHNQSICLIKLTPNGSRVATTSKKGTLIRIYLTTNGKLWEQLRVGYQLCKILDLSFYEEGNVLSCLTEKSMVILFNVKLESSQEQSESEKRGYKIYQQKNPKSMFSFLSLFNSKLGNQHPFAYFKLIRPDEQNKENKESKIEKQQIKISQFDKSFDKSIQPSSPKKQSVMDIVHEEIDEHLENTANKNQTQLVPEEVKIQEIDMAPRQSKMQKSQSSLSNNKSGKRTKSLLKKLFNKKQNYVFAGKTYNTVSKLFVGGNNFIYVAKGPFIFALKYDPFNGGEMYSKQIRKFY